MQELLDLVQSFGKPKILCLGDMMQDLFIFGKVERICPEAPVPIFLEESRHECQGGAGRVRDMVNALGAESLVISSFLMPLKTRFMVGDRQIFRHDEEEIKELDSDDEATMIDRLEAAIPKYDIILISDYGKGACSARVMDAVWNFAKQHKKKWIVDPALGSNPAKYNGASCIVPNRKKFTPQIADMIQYGTTEAVLNTADKDGMYLYTRDLSNPINVHLPSIAKHVRDCIGASDQVLSMLGVAMAGGATWVQAAQLANIAAGIKVGRGPVDPLVCLADVLEWMYCNEDTAQLSERFVKTGL